MNSKTRVTSPCFPWEAPFPHVCRRKLATDIACACPSRIGCCQTVRHLDSHGSPSGISPTAPSHPFRCVDGRSRDEAVRLLLLPGLGAGLLSRLPYVHQTVWNRASASHPINLLGQETACCRLIQQGTSCYTKCLSGSTVPWAVKQKRSAKPTSFHPAQPTDRADGLGTDKGT